MKTLKIQWNSDDYEYGLHDNGEKIGSLCLVARSFIGESSEIKIAVKNPKKKGWFKVDCIPAVKTIIKRRKLEFFGATLRCYLQEFCGVKVGTCSNYSFYAKFE